MAELLFYMEKLRGLMKKYNYVVQRYHVQYLAQFDALVLNDTIQVSSSVINGHLCAIHGLEKKKGFIFLFSEFKTFALLYRTCVYVLKRSQF